MWISFGSGKLGDELREIRETQERIEYLLLLNTEVDMTTNDELNEINAKLDEAQSELGGLPAEIAELLTQVGDQADPALVASIKAKADALADIVPNAPVETPPVEETPEVPVEETPVDETPVAEPAPLPEETPVEENPVADDGSTV